MVLPLTREWIEIINFNHCGAVGTFSLLRGSGLKSESLVKKYRRAKVLPLTREWIEIRAEYVPRPEIDCSPSYEGVD